MDGGAFPSEVGYFGWMAGLCNSWVFPLKGNRLKRRTVMTNTRPHFLPHGGMMLSTNAAIMQLCTKIAKDLRIDPIDFLKQNAVEAGHVGLSGEVFASCGLKECLDIVRRESGWDAKFGKLPEWHGIGVGIGAMAAGRKGRSSTIRPRRRSSWVRTVWPRCSPVSRTWVRAPIPRWR